MNIPGLFYSFPATALPDFSSIAELSRAACVVPAALQGRSFTELPDSDPVAQLRRELELVPDFPAFEAREAAEASHKYGRVDLRPAVDSIAPAANSVVFPGGASSTHLNDLIGAVMTRFGTFCQLQGAFYYPPGGFRTWHTNRYDVPGWRMYLVDVDQSARSYFRFVRPSDGRLVTVWDQPGTVNFFRIDPAAPLWHCIGNVGTRRWSKGFVVPADWQQRLLG